MLGFMTPAYVGERIADKLGSDATRVAAVHVCDPTRMSKKTYRM
jgi:hypothetical protein